jgi:hypothetical protein
MLLTIGNPKTLKGQKKGYLTAVLHLAPHTLSGRNVCPMATAGCAAACLNTAGRGGIGLDDRHPEDHPIQGARIRRTNWYFDDRRGFMAQLVKDVEAVVRKAKREGLTPCIRLNGTSDIRWETVFAHRGNSVYANIMLAFPDVQFYDYTKLPNRRSLPANYHLTYSLAEGERNQRGAEVAFDHGYNVAVVLRGCGDSQHPKPFPDTWRGRPLVDGDESDLRFLDGHGNYVGLRAKGRAKHDTTGFVYDAKEDS